MARTLPLSRCSFTIMAPPQGIKLHPTVNVPADTTLVVLGKDSPIYLEESDRIEAGASASGDLDIIISYGELDDA